LSVAQRILIHNLLTALQRDIRRQTRQKRNQFGAFSLFPFGFAPTDQLDERQLVNKFLAWLSAKAAPSMAPSLSAEKKTQHCAG